MKYAYQAVDRIPDQLQDGVVYHTEEFELAAFLCACGRGHRVTILVPDSHQVSSEKGLATIRPSIGVCDAACRSHYFITAGRVDWLPSFTASQTSSIMRNQIARHAISHPNRQAWHQHLRNAAFRVVSTVQEFFRNMFN